MRRTWAAYFLAILVLFGGGYYVFNNPQLFGAPTKAKADSDADAKKKDGENVVEWRNPSVAGYAATRVQFDRPLASFQLTQQKLVELHNEIAKSLLLAYHFGRLKQQGELDPVQGLPVYLCVPFNLIGPGLSDAYAPAALARRLMSARRKEETRFLLRNASAVRDYVDIRDAVRAYYSVVATGQSGICYNVGRGIPISILELVRTMASVLEVKVEIVPDESARWNERSGIRRSIADISRIQRETGWEPRMSFRESVRDLLLAVSRAEDL